MNTTAPKHQIDLQPIHSVPESFWRRCVFSIDHKVIAKQFMWGGLFFLGYGGLLIMALRWQWMNPGQPVPIIGELFFSNSGGVVPPAQFTSLFTNHGLIMIFWAITPLIIGFLGNLAIPLMIGARDMAFPALNMASFWTFAASGVCVLGSFFLPFGAAKAGWTTYPPLATNVGTPGHGQSLMVLAIFLIGSSSLMGAINYVTTIIRLRAPGMGYMRLPLTIWGLFMTSILNVLFVPVLASGGLLLLMDRLFGTDFFVAGAQGSGDPVIFQHLFWIFGHPEVYILILPAWGLTGDLLSFFSRKPAAWYRGSVYAMIGVTVLSGFVYGHHMYVAGMAPMLGLAFEMLTLAISVPAVLLFLNWLHTLWRGSIQLTSPMLFALGTVFVFGGGGLTGLHLGTISTDIYLHDTLWVVGHFHLTMASATFLASFAAIYFWFPKLFGHCLDERLGKSHFWLSCVFLSLTFFTMLLTGYGGQHRRLWDPYQYEFISRLLPLNQLTSMFAYTAAGSQLIFVYNVIRSRKHGKVAGKNPWNVGTLEWTLPSPPPNYNFKVIPTVHHGPHRLSDPLVIEALGQDWVAQDAPPIPAIEEASTQAEEVAPEAEVAVAPEAEVAVAPEEEVAVAPEEEVAAAPEEVAAAPEEEVAAAPEEEVASADEDEKPPEPTS